MGEVIKSADKTLKPWRASIVALVLLIGGCSFNYDQLRASHDAAVSPDGSAGAVVQPSGTGGVGGIGGSGGSVGAGTAGMGGTAGGTGAAATTGGAGAAGSTGAGDTAGSTGAAGTAGPTGLAGATGSAGTMGTAGTTGVAGTTGSAGTDGGTAGTGGPPDAGTDTAPPGCNCMLKVQYEGRQNGPIVLVVEYSIKVVNTGTTTISLNGVSVRYWYTIDGTGAQAGTCTSAAHPCTVAFQAATPPKAGADHYAVISFAGGTLAPGADTGEIQIQMQGTGMYTQMNDYSFANTGANFNDQTQITGYVSGKLLWGTPP